MSLESEQEVSGTRGQRNNPVMLRLMVVLLLVGVAALATPASGSGLELPGMGARGRAMGYAMVGVADDWTAILYNPAGLVQITGSRFGAEYGLMIGDVTSTRSLRNLSVGGNPLRGDFIDPTGLEPSSFGEKSVEAIINGGALGYAICKGKLAFGMGAYGSGSGSTEIHDCIGR